MLLKESEWQHQYGAGWRPDNITTFARTIHTFLRIGQNTERDGENQIRRHTNAFGQALPVRKEDSGR